jgi:quercetin dioxygenase-like cupin family protein
MSLHGPRIHRHPYEEIFIVLEGRPRFTVGLQTLDEQQHESPGRPGDQWHGLVGEAAA